MERSTQHFSLDDDERFLEEVFSSPSMSTQQPLAGNPHLADMQAEIMQDKLVYLEQEREDAVYREDYAVADRCEAEIDVLRTKIQRAARAACPQAPSPFQVGDIVRIVIENEPDVPEDPDRDGTANKMGQIVDEDGSHQAFLVRFADGLECWYKAAWITSQKAIKAAAEAARRKEEAEEAKLAAAMAPASASSSSTSSADADSSVVDGHAASDAVEILPEVSQPCIQLIIDGSQKEERAMVFDRAGAYPGAIGLYREGASMLAEALNLMPMHHPDRPVMEIHIREVHARANYLQSLGKDPAEIPLEEMIHGRQLKLGTCARGAETSLAAGAVLGVAGLALHGPLVGIALAAGAAYATTRQDGVGKAARTVGDAGLKAADGTRSLNNKYRIDEKIDKKLGISQRASAIDEKLHVSQLANQAGATARAVNERLSVVERTQAAAEQTSSFVKSVDKKLQISNATKAAVGKTGQALSNFNEKHQITGKVGIGVNDATTRLSSWVTKKVSSSLSASNSSSSQPAQ